jgi:hypothetical protein
MSVVISGNFVVCGFQNPLWCALASRDKGFPLHARTYYYNMHVQCTCIMTLIRQQ